MAEAEESLLDSPSCSVDSGAVGHNRRLESQFSVQKELLCNDGESICKDGHGLDVHCPNKNLECRWSGNLTDVVVYCPNKHLGCEWSGSLTDVVEHMNHECECSPVSLLLDESVEMPMIIMMRGFEQLKRNNESWYSPVFCTHEKGYHFRLRVDANGWCGTGDGVAVVVSIVKGDYDDQLQWPFEGVITVQILNHISNSAHSVLTDFEFSSGGYECQQVTDETQPEYGCFCDQFIMHESLTYDSVKNSQYLKNDSLYFLVSYRPLHS